LSIVFGLVFALSALGVAAAPVSAETILKGCHKNATSALMGDCGYWEVYDASVGKKGAVCVYANNFPYELNVITVRPPLMHGLYSNKTPVGWRFSVQRKTVSGTTWSTRYTSTYQMSTANEAIPAYVGHGFSRRAWNAPNDPSGYFYRIIIELIWKRNGTTEGYVKLKYDWYKAQRSGATYTNPDYCLASY
jgi:hypothetical protein